MSKTAVAAIAGGVGLIAGLLIARAVYRAKVAGGIGQALGAFGLGGGTIQSIAEAVVLDGS